MTHRSGSRRAKMTHNGHKNKKKLRKFMFWSAESSILRAENFCRLDVFYGGLGISKLQSLIKKMSNVFSPVNFSNFWSSKPWIRIGIQPKMLSAQCSMLYSMNPDSNNTGFFTSWIFLFRRLFSLTRTTCLRSFLPSFRPASSCFFSDIKHRISNI